MYLRRSLRSKTPDLVRQKFDALWLVHFAIRRLMHEAALHKDIDPDRLPVQSQPANRARQAALFGSHSPQGAINFGMRS